MTDQSPIGHNIGDQAVNYGEEVIERLNIDFKELRREAEAVLAEAREAPKEVNDDDALNKNASLIQRIRDLNARAKAFHVKEKEPYLRRGEAVDQFFFGLMDKLFRRAKGNNPGAADILQARNTDYLLRKEEAERQRREAEEAAKRAEAERIRKEQEEAARKAAEAAEAARQATLKAERARNDAKIAANKKAAEEAAAAAQKAADEAATLARQAETAEQAATDASIDANRGAADLARTRGEGVLSTLKMEGFAEIKNGEAAKLDAVALWAYVPIKAKEQALSAWAKANDYGVQMEGALIGKRRKGMTR